MSDVEDVVSLKVDAETSTFMSKIKACWDAVSEAAHGMIENLTEAGEGFDLLQEKVAETAELTKISMDTATTAVGGLAEVFAAGTLVAGMGALIHNTEETAVMLGKLSKATGESVQNLSALMFASEMSDMQFGQVSTALMRLARSMEMASQGSKQQADAFKQLGIDTSSWHEKLPPVLDIMLQMADKMQGVTDHSRAVAISMELMGRGAQVMVPMLMEGGDKLRELMQHAKDAGMTMNDSTVAAAEKLHGEVTVLSAAMRADLFPVFEGIVTALQYLGAGLVEAKAGFEIMGRFALAAFLNISRPLNAVVQAWDDFRSGSLNQAKNDLKEGFSLAPMKADWQLAWDDAQRITKQAMDRVDAIFDENLAELAGKESQFADLGEKETEAHKKAVKELSNIQFKAMQERARAMDEQEKQNERLAMQQAEIWIKSEDEKLKAMKKSQSEEIAGLRESLSASEAAATQKEQDENAHTQALLRTRQISFNQSIAMERAAADAAYATKVELVKAKLQIDALDPDNPRQKERDLKELEKIEDEHRRTETKLDDQVMEHKKQQYDSFFHGITGGFDGAINAMVMGTETFSQAFGNILTDIELEFLRMLEKMVLQWVEDHIFMMIFGRTTQATGAATQIASNAAVASAAAYASTAAIPIVGPELAPAAAGLAYGNVMAMEGLNAFHGGGDVSTEQLAVLKRNEMVLDDDLANHIRRTAGNGGREVHVHYSPQVQMIDGSDLKTHLTKHRRDVISVIKAAQRDGEL